MDVLLNRGDLHYVVQIQNAQAVTSLQDREKLVASEREWAELVKPIVRKCRLAVSLDLNTTFNIDGSTALADLLEQLAKTLDDENVRRETVA